MRIALVGLLLTGCISIEAEIEESCVTRRDIHVDGVATTSLTKTFLVDDLSDVHRLLEHDAEIELARADVRATSGVTSLAFVDAAAIAIDNVGVYGCDGDCPTTGNALAIPPTSQQSAVELLAAEQIAITLEVTGALPADAWTVDVDVCVRGTLSY